MSDLRDNDASCIDGDTILRRAPNKTASLTTGRTKAKGRGESLANNGVLVGLGGNETIIMKLYRKALKKKTSSPLGSNCFGQAGVLHFRGRTFLGRKRSRCGIDYLII